MKWTHSPTEEIELVCIRCEIKFTTSKNQIDRKGAHDPDDHLEHACDDCREKEQLIGDSPKFLDAIQNADRFSRRSSHVFIHAPTGAGKELLAQRMHWKSGRKGKFIVADCTNPGAGTVESKWFGHEQGAFTGAINAYKGIFEEADGGTVLIDELGKLELDFQAKLLRVTQTGQIQRVGGKMRTVDVRIISATNRDIKAMVRDGTFDVDLYYRLYKCVIRLPPLSERDDDAVLIAEHILSTKFPGKSFTPGAKEELRSYHWPGNVRELETVIEDSAGSVLANPWIDRDVIREYIKEISLEFDISAVRNQLASADEAEPSPVEDTITEDLPCLESVDTIDCGGSASFEQEDTDQIKMEWPETTPPRQMMVDTEKMAIEKTLRQTKGNKAWAAELLEWDRNTLAAKISKHGIVIPDD